MNSNLANKRFYFSLLSVVMNLLVATSLYAQTTNNSASITFDGQVNSGTCSIQFSDSAETGNVNQTFNIYMGTIPRSMFTAANSRGVNKYFTLRLNNCSAALPANTTKVRVSITPQGGTLTSDGKIPNSFNNGGGTNKMMLEFVNDLGNPINLNSTDENSTSTLPSIPVTNGSGSRRYNFRYFTAEGIAPNENKFESNLTVTVSVN